MASRSNPIGWPGPFLRDPTKRLALVRRSELLLGTDFLDWGRSCDYGNRSFVDPIICDCIQNYMAYREGSLGRYGRSELAPILSVLCLMSHSTSVVETHDKGRET